MVLKLLNTCDWFGKLNRIIFNPLKSHTLFLNIRHVIFCPDMIFNPKILEHSTNVKYLGCKMNTKLSNEDDISKELRTLYIRSNVSVLTFRKYNEQDKIELFKSY